MNPSAHLVVFHLDDQRFALPLATVERIVRVVEVTPLPGAPDIVIGVVNVRGTVVPVVNLRRRLHLRERAIRRTDQLIIARTSRRTVALVADQVAGVVESPKQSIVAPESILPRLQHVRGVVKFPDGLVLVHDLESFLSLEEETALHQALRAEPAASP